MKCRSCGAELVWAQTAKGKAIPIDATPTDAGNIVLQFPDDPRDPPVAHMDLKRRLDGPRYVAHFATCPNADEHRRPR